jgi:nicotinate-nucleotide adenylyltransferase
MGKRKRIALYGGSFDPVHVGHAAVARELSRLFALDEVLFIPAHVAPHKRGRKVSSPLHRHAMLALATQGEPRFRVSTVELDAPERPFTVDTLSRLLAVYGERARLFFVMGADSWMEITTWREWERVLTLTDQIVVTRPGYELETSHVTPFIRERIVDVRGAGAEQVEAALKASLDASDATRIYLTDAARVDAAATDIRRAVAGDAGEWAGLASLVAPPVAEYINKYGLYREGSGAELLDAGTNRTH